MSEPTALLSKPTGQNAGRSIDPRPVLSVLVPVLFLTALAGCRSSVDIVEWARPRSIELPAPEAHFVLPRLDEFFTVESEFEGQGPYRLLFDTGTLYLIISEQAARSLLEQEPRETGPFYSDWFGDKKEIGRFFRVSSARLGSVQLKDVMVTSIDFGDWDAEIQRSPQGIVGTQTFRDKFLIVDFRTGDMWVRDDAPDSLPPADASVPFKWGLGTVNAEIVVGGKRTWAVIDSGSSLGLQVPRIDDFPILENWEPWGVARDLYSSKQYFKAELDTDVMIGDTVLRSPWVYSSPDFPQLNVGMEILKHFKMTLDTKNGRLWLEGPEDKQLVVDEPETLRGIEPTASESPLPANESG